MKASRGKPGTFSASACALFASAMVLSATNARAGGYDNLFDEDRTFEGSAAAVGFFQARDPSTDLSHSGWEIRFAREVETANPKHFYLIGQNGFSFRSFDSKSFSFVAFQPDVMAGVRLGPLEIGTGLDVSFLSIDDFHTHWSVQSLSPRIHADAALRLNGLRIAAQIFSEYYWRWGGDDRRMRGFAFTISFDQPPHAHPPPRIIQRPGPRIDGDPSSDNAP